MPDTKLKVVVVDDNEERKKNIGEILPDYLDVELTVYGNSAKERIMPASDGRKCNLVIMNADDRKGQALYMFDWMVNDEGGLGLDRIPVLLLVEDEFSDRVLSFLELGNPKFYEGDIDPDEFFFTVTKILNEAEFLPEPVDEPPAYTEKSTSRVQGLSIKPEGEDENTVKRSVVFNDEELLDHLNTALERGRKKQELVREIFQAAAELKEKKQDIKPTPAPKAPLYSLDAHKVSAMLDDTPTKYEEPVRESVKETTKTIVIVDADNTNLKTCEIFLKRKYNVVLLNSGMNAIDYFVRNSADLLLISYNMPYLDGIKILDSIRWQPNGKKVPTIFMAEGNIEAIKPLCRKERVVGMLQKPVSPTAIKQAVEAVFAGSR